MDNKPFFTEMNSFFKQKDIKTCKLKENPRYLNTSCNVFPKTKGTRFSVWWREKKNVVLLSVQSENKCASDMVDKIFEKYKDEFFKVDSKIKCEKGVYQKDWRRINIAIKCEGEFSGIIKECKAQSMRLIELFNDLAK